MLPTDRADRFMSAPLTIKAGDVLCSEPWAPCWQPATHFRPTPRGDIVTCRRCCDIDAEELPPARSKP